jgi:hypothetical protein
MRDGTAALLGEAVQARLLGLPAGEREMIRHATLGSEDFARSAAARLTNSASH